MTMLFKIIILKIKACFKLLFKIKIKTKKDDLNCLISSSVAHDAFKSPTLRSPKGRNLFTFFPEGHLNTNKIDRFV